MVNILFFTAALFSFLLAPKMYDVFFVQIITTAFLLQIIPFVINKSKENYINFYSLFYFSYFFINFFYPSVLYPIDPEFFSVFTLPFNHDVISKSTALAWLASSSFIMGAARKVNVVKNDETKLPPTVFRHFNTSLITGFLVLAFVATVGKDFLSGNFDGHSAFSLYILQLVVCCFLLTTVVFFRNYNTQRNKYLFFAIAVFYIVLFLGIGDRGPALSLLILALSLYSHYVKKINLGLIIPLAILGILLMHLIGEGRSVDVVASSDNVVIKGLENFEFNINNYYKATRGFVVNAWTLYSGVDYVDTHGVNFGSTLIKPVLSVFPFLLGLLQAAFGLYFQTSSDFFTEQVLGKNASWGVGTNLVTDVYIAFGMFGCIVLFYLFGLFIEKSRVNTLVNNTVKSNLIYFGMLSYAIYMPRTSLFMPLKIIFWTYLIYYLLRSLKLLTPIKKVGHGK